MPVEVDHRGDEGADLPEAGGHQDPRPGSPRRPQPRPRPSTPRPSTRRLMGRDDLAAEIDLDPADAEFDPELDADPNDARPQRAAAAPAPAPTAHRHPAWLARMAEDLGVDPAEVRETPTDELAAHVRAAQRFLLKERAAASRTQGQIDAARPEGGSGPRGPLPAEPPANPLGFSDEPADDNPALTKDGYDRKLVQALNTLWKRNQELEERVSGTAEQVRRRDTQANYEKLDDAFAAVAGLYPHLGSGAGAELGADSDEMARRVAVIHAAGLDLSKLLPSSAVVTAKVKAAAARLFGRPAAGPNPTGKPAPAADPYARAAGAGPPAPKPGKPSGVRVEYDDDGPADEDEERKRAWMAAGSPMPTGRRSPQEPKGRRRAARAIVPLLRDEGLNGDVPGSDEEADLPQ